MLQSPLFWIILVLATLLGMTYSWSMRHPSYKEVQKGKIALVDREIEALNTLLFDADIEPGRVLVVQTREELPRFHPEQHWLRDWFDRYLWSFRRFGKYESIRRAIAIEDEHVVGLSLPETSLAHLDPLADLPALRRLNLYDNAIEQVSGIPDDCQWIEVNLNKNKLTDLSPLRACVRLKNLKARNNRIAELPDVTPMDRLEKLDLSFNEITRVNTLSTHPRLQSLELFHNRIDTLEGLNQLPGLQWLDVSENALTSIQGLYDLPSLTVLRVGSNQIDQVELDVLRGLPDLRSVHLYNNHITTMPTAYQPTTGEADTYHPRNGSVPKINVQNNPVTR